MDAWPTLLLTSLLCGQGAKPMAGPPAVPAAQRLKLRAVAMTPQQMLRAMVALEQAHSTQPGATVEVIGYDNEAALNLMALRLAEQVHLGFRPMESHGHQELYAFMHQDPSRPGPVLLVPVLAGGKLTRAEDKWLR